MSSHHFLLISDPNSFAPALVQSTLATDDDLTMARDPWEAIKLVRGGEPDAILWAVDPGDPNSIIACRRLRGLSSAPIVMLVDRHSTEQVVRGYRLGADAHIAIPCDRREFRARFGAVLRRGSWSA